MIRTGKCIQAMLLSSSNEPTNEELQNSHNFEILIWSEKRAKRSHEEEPQMPLLFLKYLGYGIKMTSIADNVIRS